MSYLFPVPKYGNQIERHLRRVMLKTNLYFDKIDFCKYLPQTNCGECGFSDCNALLEKLKANEIKPESCPYLSKNMAYAFHTALNAERIIPEMELVQLPVPAESGLVEFNMPDRKAPLLISGNSELTQLALSAILSTTIMPFYVLFIDTRGNTLDMAMIYGTFTEDRIKCMIEDSNIMERLDHREMVIPGLAEPLDEEIRRITRWNVNTGPVCCGELPIYFGEDWLAP